LKKEGKKRTKARKMGKIGKKSNEKK